MQLAIRIISFSSIARGIIPRIEMFFPHLSTRVFAYYFFSDWLLTGINYKGAQRNKKISHWNFHLPKPTKPHPHTKRLSCSTSGMEVCRSGMERRKSEVQRRMQDMERRTSYMECRMQDLEVRTSDEERCTLDMEGSTQDMEHRMTGKEGFMWDIRASFSFKMS